jgi:hypothetical protein
MLKFENSARIGDSIRAFDFMPMPGRDDCYIEGTIVDINHDAGFKAFVIECTNDTFQSRVGQTIFVPMQVSFMEYEGRVVKLND